MSKIRYLLLLYIYVVFGWISGFGEFIDTSTSVIADFKRADVAMCIAGQTRTFQREDVYKNIYNRMINPLENHVDIFFALSAFQGKFNPKRIHSDKLPTGIADLYPNVRNVSFKHVQSINDATGVCRNAINRTGAVCDGCEMTGFGQAYSLLSCELMISNFEETERKGKKYTWVIRLRPDTVYGFSLPPYHLWPTVTSRTSPKNIFFHIGNLNYCKSLCATDIWALMTRNVARAFLYDHFYFIFTKPSCSDALKKLQSKCQECKLTYTVLEKGPKDTQFCKFTSESLKSKLQQFIVRYSDQVPFADSGMGYLPKSFPGKNTDGLFNFSALADFNIEANDSKCIINWAGMQKKTM
jgi:hypothetical protein